MIDQPPPTGPPTPGTPSQRRAGRGPQEDHRQGRGQGAARPHQSTSCPPPMQVPPALSPALLISWVFSPCVHVHLSICLCFSVLIS